MDFKAPGTSKKSSTLHILNDDKSALDPSFITFNLSGRKFQITELAFSMLKPDVLDRGVVIFNTKDNKNEYFFTRNINCFVAILDFLENGYLHIPATVCPLAFQKEIDFWGLQLSHLEICCRRQYQEFVNHQYFLNKFVFDKPGQKDVLPTTCWGKTRKRGWDVLNNPSSSWWAKGCLAIKAIAVFIFIIESAASTHNLFEIKITYDNLPEYMDSNKETFTCLCLNDHEEVDNNFIQQLCAIFRGSQQNSSSMHKRDALDGLKDYKHIEFDVSFAEGKANSDVSINMINQTKESTNYPNKNPPNFVDLNITGSNILFDPETTIVDTVRQMNSTTEFGDKHNRELLPNGLELLGTILINNTSVDNKTLRTGQSARLSNRNANPNFASRVRRNIELLRIHPLDPLDDHENHIEDIVIYKTVDWIEIVEIVITLYFVAEYIVQLIFAPDKLRYVMSFYSFVDVMTIVSVSVLHIYVDLLHPELRYTNGRWEFLKAVESLKTLKLFKLVKDTRGFMVIKNCIKSTYKDILSLFSYVGFILTIISFFMYYLEKDNMQSIPNAMWWSVVTLTTLGYGDVVPTSRYGKLLGSVVAVSGILMLALMVPIFVNDFVIINKFSKHKRNKKVPRCSLFPSSDRKVIIPDTFKSKTTLTTLIKQTKTKLAQTKTELARSSSSENSFIENINLRRNDSLSFF